MGSHLDEKGICDAGAAICGSCKTENLGLEKVIANIISNPNIRFLLLCGTEVKGHLAGQTFAALHKGGVKDGRVVGAEGAIPFIENLNDALSSASRSSLNSSTSWSPKTSALSRPRSTNSRAGTRVHSLASPWSSRSRKLPAA